MFKAPLQVTVGIALIALAVTVSPASAQQPGCQVKNLSAHNLQYNSNTQANPLATAIAEARSGDTLQVIGTCYGNFVVDKDLTLRGRSSNQHADTITGNGSGIILRNASSAGAFDLTLSDLTITGGETGVTNDAASLSMTRTKVTGNTGSGIVSGFVASTTIEGSVVSDNDGVGVAGSFFGSLTIDNSTVRDNMVGGVSGGRASVTISNSLIADNSGFGVAGSRQIQIANSLIEDNTSAGAGVGGGIALFDLGTLHLTDSIVRGNTASRGGGVSFGESLSPNTITRSVVTGNSATEAGGGIYGPGDDLLSITGSTVSNNSAPSGGGMFLFAHTGNRTEITNSTVTGNTAVYGGGIWNDSLLTLRDSAVTGNTATAAGGGIFGTGTVVFNGTDIVCGNTPNDWPGCMP